jgi:hypothetical protein
MPDSLIHVDGIYNTIEVYNNTIYLAPFVGNSIHVMRSADSTKAITFTDDVNYRIKDFAIMPFTVYINNGQHVDKYYTVSGEKKEIFRAKQIGHFIATQDEELIIIDQFENELVFLDFLYQRRLTLSDINIKDLYATDGQLYALSNNRILLYDEHGNLHNTIQTPITPTNIIVQDSIIYVYGRNDNRLYMKTAAWQTIELDFSIQDIAVYKGILVILENTGSHLHFIDPGKINR